MARMRVLLERRRRDIGDIMTVVDVPGDIQAGPLSDRLRMHAESSVSPDADGDFLFDWSDAVGSLRADAAHTFAVAHLTTEMVGNALGHVPPWSWGVEEPLLLAPHRKPPGTTRYIREQRAASFSRPQGEEEDPGKMKFFECRSMETVAHEIGHAVLDGLRPEWWVGETAVETRAIHEAWADLTGLFLALSFDSLIESALDSSGGFAVDNTFAVFGENRQVTSVATGVRRLDEPWTVQDALNHRTPTGLVDAYAVSRLLSSLVYDVLVFWSGELRRAGQDPATAVREAGNVLRPAALRACAEAEKATLAIILQGFQDQATILAGKELADAIRRSAHTRQLM